MKHTHTVQFAGETHTRVSQSRTYTHAVAVTRAPFASHGYEYPETSFVLSWSSSEKLAQAAARTARAKRQFDGTEYERGALTLGGLNDGRWNRRRRRTVGNGPLVYSRVEVLPVTVTTKELDPKRLVTTLTKRALKEGQRAVYYATLPADTKVSDEVAATLAGDAARWAVSNANKVLAAQAGSLCELEAR